MTPRQHDTLLAIDALRVELGRPPTVQAVADQIGVAKASAHEHVRLLREHGLVEEPNGKIGVRLTKDGTEAARAEASALAALQLAWGRANKEQRTSFIRWTRRA